MFKVRETQSIFSLKPEADLILEVPGDREEGIFQGFFFLEGGVLLFRAAPAAYG